MSVLESAAPGGTEEKLKEVERKQSDLDSGLESDEKNNSARNVNNKLFILTADNEHLMNKVEELKAVNRRLERELQEKMKLLSTQELMISTLELAVKQREAAYRELSEKYDTFCELVGAVRSPDAWSLALIRRLLQRIETDEAAASEDSSEEELQRLHFHLALYPYPSKKVPGRLKYIVNLLEESLAKMDHALETEATRRELIETQMKKLHAELKALISANTDLKDRADWYELKSAGLERSLRKRLRSCEQLKSHLSQLQDVNEDLTYKLNDKKSKKKKRISAPLSESATDAFSIQNISKHLPRESDILAEYEKIQLKLIEEETKGKDLKNRLDKMFDERDLLLQQNAGLEKKVDSLKRFFIKLAIKHRHSVTLRNESLAILKGTVEQLRDFTEVAGTDFIERLEEKKGVVDSLLDCYFNHRYFSDPSVSDNGVFVSTDEDTIGSVSEVFQNVDQNDEGAPSDNETSEPLEVLLEEDINISPHSSIR